MSDERSVGADLSCPSPIYRPSVDVPVARGNVTSQPSPMGRDKSGPYESLCELDGEGHCVTCSDEALPARVLGVDRETGLALVEVKDTTEEIDVTLVDDVVPGDLLLVHGGVAIGHAGEANDE